MMFGFLKRTNPSSMTAGGLKEILAAAEIELRDKWSQYNRLLLFKDDVPLWKKIESFVPLAQEFIGKKYPVILTGPARVFWLLIFNAIRQSGTNTVEEINVAIVELRKICVVAGAE